MSPSATCKPRTDKERTNERLRQQVVADATREDRARIAAERAVERGQRAAAARVRGEIDPQRIDDGDTAEQRRVYREIEAMRAEKIAERAPSGASTNWLRMAEQADREMAKRRARASLKARRKVARRACG